MPKNAYKSVDDKRVKNVHITVADEEFKILVKEAKKHGMNRAQYCRHKLFYERKED